MEVSVALVTVTMVDPTTALCGRVAEIVAPPAPTASRSPWLPGALLISATAVSEDDHVTEVVRS